MPVLPNDPLLIPTEDQKLSVLFCCLGNICRSPMAEAAFRHIVDKHSLSSRISTIDSCGTASYHAGSSPDSRTVSTLRKHGITTSHRARHVRDSDYREFDYIFAMDMSNLRELRAYRPVGEAAKRARIMLFGVFGAGGEEIVEDPYYGGKEGFEENFKQVCRFSRGFAKEVLGVEIPEEGA